MIRYHKSFLKKSIFTLFIIHYSLFTALFAGLTDFKTIDAAKKAYESKEYGKSAVLLGGLESKTPQKEYDIGNAYYKAGKYDAAIKAYGQAEGVDEQQRLHNVGNSYFQKKEWDKAIKTYEKALKIKEDKDTRFNLELAKKMKKRQQEQKKKNQKQNKNKKDQKKKNNKKQDQKQQNKDQNKKNDQQKKQDKKEQNKQDKKKQQQKQDQKNKQDQKKKAGQKKKENEKKEGDKKQSDSKKEKQAKEKKGDKDSAQPKDQNNMSKAEKLKVQELKRLLKKMGAKKTPTMIYQMGENKKHKRDENVKPW